MANMLRRMNQRTLAIILFLVILSIIGIMAVLTYLFGDIVVNVVGLSIIAGLAAGFLFGFCMVLAEMIKEWNT